MPGGRKKKKKGSTKKKKRARAPSTTDKKGAVHAVSNLSYPKMSRFPCLRGEFKQAHVDWFCDNELLHSELCTRAVSWIAHLASLVTYQIPVQPLHNELGLLIEEKDLRPELTSVLGELGIAADWSADWHEKETLFLSACQALDNKMSEQDVSGQTPPQAVSMLMRSWEKRQLREAKLGKKLRYSRVCRKIAEQSLSVAQRLSGFSRLRGGPLSIKPQTLVSTLFARRLLLPEASDYAGETKIPEIPEICTRTKTVGQGRRQRVISETGLSVPLWVITVDGDVLLAKIPELGRPGRITSVNENGTYDIEFDDGTEARCVQTRRMLCIPGTVECTLACGSPTCTVADVTGLTVGMPVSGDRIPMGTTLLGIAGDANPYTLTLSENATGSGANFLTFEGAASDPRLGNRVHANVEDTFPGRSARTHIGEDGKLVFVPFDNTTVAQGQPLYIDNPHAQVVASETLRDVIDPNWKAMQRHSNDRKLPDLTLDRLMK